MLEQYYRINEAAGVQIHQRHDGNVMINACSVAVENGQLNFEKKITGIVSADDLNKHFPPQTGLSVNLSGKGILQKRIEKTEIIDRHNFSKLLPNASIDDFYVQHFISGDHSFVSVIRKADADKWLSQLKDLGFAVLMLSLGPFPVETIISQLNIYGNELVFNGYKILRNEQMEWLSVAHDEAITAPFPLKLESESISEKLLIAYAAAFQLVLGDKVIPILAEVPALEATFQKIIAEKKLKAQGFLILLVIFILLLINFFLFSRLNTSNIKLTGELSRSAHHTDNIQQMNDDIQKKEALLDTLGWEGSVNKSALVDQLAALLPPEITWKEAAVDPVDLSKTRSQKSIAFDHRKLRITGNAEKIIPVNEWMARIKTKTWVKNVQLGSYTFNSELNTGQFTIVIDY